MGQQQLLLVILVTIIVGIATVVAINTFGSAADAANLDAVRQDITGIAADAQGYFMKPTMLGGGSRSFDGIGFHTITFSGRQLSELVAENENGTYELLSDGNESGITLHAFASSEYVNGSPAGDPTFIVKILPNSLEWVGGSVLDE